MLPNTKYISVDRKDLSQFFVLEGNKLFLKSSTARSISLTLPLQLNKEIARIAGMLYDGYIEKSLGAVQFYQKKDLNKPYEFARIVKKYFDVKPCFSSKQGGIGVVFNSKILANFFHHCLNFHKSDQDARVPKWIFDSSEEIVSEYLRYAFAMEGSISTPTKGTEIKFHSCDLSLVVDLRNLLKARYGINARIQKYFIHSYGWKYYLYFSSKDDLEKFAKIGFALDSHQKRLDQILSTLKSKAWEITLVSIFKTGKPQMRLNEIAGLFPYLGKKAIFCRLRDLRKNGYIRSHNANYSLTQEGLKVAIALKDKVNNLKLRTNPRINESRVFAYLKQYGAGYRNKIAKELGIDANTVRDVLNRLANKKLIKQTDIDKFQRKFYTPIIR